ncbi:MAG: phosphate/phosphite/phosphonate ABC transporter substrate-binding protein [Anaerolineae bacterium]|jgi:phosphonate transport system substrate-binding protein
MDVKITSLQAENADFVVAAVTGYIAERLGASAEFIVDLPWQERESLLDVGQIQVGWMCGLTYVRKVDRPNPAIELLAAPVMQGARYGGRPVYFSDVLVRADSRFSTFGDLRGTIWAYNEPGSHSGYNVVRHHLAVLGEPSGYFGRVIESGAHQVSLQMILDGSIDASAIDSTVLEEEFRRDLSLRSRLRIVDSLGPSPIPPWIVQRSLPRDLRGTLREILLTMHQDPRGRAILAQGHMTRFAHVEDSDYNAIRHMARMAESVRL